MIQLALELKLTEVIISLWLIWFTLNIQRETDTSMASMEERKNGVRLQAQGRWLFSRNDLSRITFFPLLGDRSQVTRQGKRAN